MLAQKISRERNNIWWTPTKITVDNQNGSLIEIVILSSINMKTGLGKRFTVINAVTKRCWLIKFERWSSKMPIIFYTAVFIYCSGQSQAFNHLELEFFLNFSRAIHHSIQQWLAMCLRHHFYRIHQTHKKKNRIPAVESSSGCNRLLQVESASPTTQSFRNLLRYVHRCFKWRRLAVRCFMLMITLGAHRMFTRSLRCRWLSPTGTGKHCCQVPAWYVPWSIWNARPPPSALVRTGDAP